MDNLLAALDILAKFRLPEDTPAPVTDVQKNIVQFIAVVNEIAEAAAFRIRFLETGKIVTDVWPDKDVD